MAVLILSLSGFFVLGKLQKHAHHQFIENNRVASQLATTVSQMNALSTNMLRSSSIDLLSEYQEKIIDLEEQIEIVRSNNDNPKDILAILRRLHNFNQYQDTLLYDSKNLKYDILTYIRDSMSFHQMAVEELVMRNYVITSSIYQTYENKLTIIEYSLWIVLLSFILGFCIIGIRTALKVFHQIDEMHNYALQLSHKRWNLADITLSGFQELDDLSIAMN